MNRTSGLKAIGWVCGLGLISGTQAGVIDPSAVLGNLGFVEQGANRALAAPDYQWWYGCSPTAAGMMLAFYDRDGYGGRTYANILPGAVAAASTYPSTAGNWDYNFQSIIASQGHVADFYRGAYNTSGDDGTAPYHAFDSLADFMGTSQDSVSNTNGSTRFWYYSNGARLTARDAKNEGVWTSDGMYGIAEFFQYAGYGDGDISDDTTIFTQLVDTQFGGTAGFSFADFMAEIDAGRTLIVQVQGHSMLGYGYNNDGGAQTIYVHDTWNPGVHSMSWGGAYAGLNIWGVTGFTPTGGAAIPVPAPLVLMLLPGAFLLRLHRHPGGSAAGVFKLKRRDAPWHDFL